MRYVCCDERRLNAVRAHPTLNGVEFLEVSDDHAAPAAERQRTLVVRLVKEIDAGALGVVNVRVEGGERIRNVAVTGLPLAPTGPEERGRDLRVRVDGPGDFSTYTLRLVRGEEDAAPPEGFDPILSSVEFSFKVACPTDFDCERETVCPPESAPAPEINYLAKDYASFRQLMLDRLAVTAPRWVERNPADLGVALVELLAYVGDQLSYRQDAVATEAYLGTARRRVSVRRHARLVDYNVHDGANARAWVRMRVGDDFAGVVTLPARTQILTRVPGLEARIPAPSGLPLNHSPEYERALAARALVFETVRAARLRAAHNEIEFYTWGDERCCLPKGATEATLKNAGGPLAELRPDDVLIFVERRNPDNGREEEANPARRHAVRLAEVTHTTDPLFNEDEAGAQPLRVVRIRWHAEDALPFALCLWDVKDIEGVGGPASVALGNVVLADHGLTVEDEPLGVVPEPNPVLSKVGARPGGFCAEKIVRPTAPRFRPQLRRGPLTHSAPAEVSGDEHPASDVMNIAAAQTLPAVRRLRGVQPDGVVSDWTWRRDLLGSNSTDKHFVVEIESDGAARLRFGDERFGSRPASGTAFTATYRVGNGASGNVGAGALAHVVTAESAIVGVGNPLPARGGVEPETIEEIRRDAPSAFRTQQRAVTEDDYARVAERHAGVQRAAATFRWTGSWRTVFLTIDRLGGAEVDAEFEADMRRHLERFRMAGHDVEIDGPRHVSLEIEMRICVRAEYMRARVRAALLELFGSRTLAGGRRGVFHPDNFTFGQSIYLSRLYAAAQGVEGVDSVEIKRFRRQGIAASDAIETGELPLERLEIARLDNDPNFPERGVFRLHAEGGR